MLEMMGHGTVNALFKKDHRYRRVLGASNRHRLRFHCSVASSGMTTRSRCRFNTGDHLPPTRPQFESCSIAEEHMEDILPMRRIDRSSRGEVPAGGKAGHSYLSARRKPSASWPKDGRARGCCPSAGHRLLCGVWYRLQSSCSGCRAFRRCRRGA